MEDGRDGVRQADDEEPCPTTCGKWSTSERTLGQVLRANSFGRRLILLCLSLQLSPQRLPSPLPLLPRRNSNLHLLQPRLPQRWTE